MSRDVAWAHTRYGAGPHYAEGDFARPESFDAAFAGIE